MRASDSGLLRILVSGSVAVVSVFGLANSALSAGLVDYSKRAAKLDPSVETSLLGRWTNPSDKLVIEIDSVDLASGKLAGKVQPTSGPAAADDHELVGWVSSAPGKEGVDNVTPITFTTSLYEYGTLPAWAGYLKDGEMTTMHYLVWPNKTYRWDHISASAETWTKLP
jgi:hypothetical protein